VPVLAGLGVTVLVAGALLWPGLWEENASGQTRIFYLHNLLLLWVSTALLGAIEIAFWHPSENAALGERRVGDGGGRDDRNTLWAGAGTTDQYAAAAMAARCGVG